MFIIAVLDSEHKAFVVHVFIFNIKLNDKMYLSKRGQIPYLKIDEALTKVPSKYTNLVDIFSPTLAAELSKYTKINNYTIKLVIN